VLGGDNIGYKKYDMPAGLLNEKENHQQTRDKDVRRVRGLCALSRKLTSHLTLCSFLVFIFAWTR